jgi:hypothetical protein
LPAATPELIGSETVVAQVREDTAIAGRARQSSGIARDCSLVAQINEQPSLRPTPIDLTPCCIEQSSGGSAHIGTGDRHRFGNRRRDQTD